MKKLFCLIITILSIINTFAQIDTAWTKRYNGPGNFKDIPNAITLDNNGNLYITGESVGTGTLYDYATIKYTNYGEQEWLRRYNNGSYDYASSLIVDNEGYIYVTGSSMGFGGSGYDYATIKYSNDGDTIWTRRFSGLGNSDDHAYAIATDRVGNVYVTGSVDRNPVDSIMGNVFFTIKYASNGDTLWSRKYRGVNTTFDVAFAMTVDTNGNVYVTGESKGEMDPSYDYDYLTIKYTTEGDTLWVAKYAGPGGRQDVPSDIEVDNLGNVYVTGKSRPDSTSFENYDYLTIKYNLYGETEWIARYDGPNNDLDEAHGLVLDDYGNIYVTGLSYGIGTGADIATIKYNSSGDTLWVRRYNGIGNGPDGANEISIDQLCNIYVAGYEYKTDTYKDYLIIKYDSNGEKKWIKSFSGEGTHDDEITAMTIDNKANVYVAGKNYGTGTNDDFLTIKYLQTPNDVDQGGSLKITPFRFVLEQNYPNPFNPITKIKYSIPQSSKVLFKIFDVLGNQIATLVNEEKLAGVYELNWNASDLPSGVYFYRLHAGSFLHTSKMILLK
jgi:hypothetical protein